jgi:hypothetical protein
MPDITHTLLSSVFDETSVKLRAILEELDGISEETLQRIDHISYPRTDCPPPQDEQSTVVYERLVLLALAEATRGAQQSTQARQKGRGDNLLVVAAPKPQGRRAFRRHTGGEARGSTPTTCEGGT